MNSKRSLSAMIKTSLVLPLITFVLSVSANATFPALIAFGDSILDTGNNNLLPAITKCNFFPYGRDFGRPTGRFGNGKVFSDIITEGLEIKAVLPAYSDPSLPNNEIPTGVGFASGGSGLDQVTARIQGVTWVTDQVTQFKAYIQKLNNVVGPEKAKEIIANAVILISAGNNDIGITFLPFRAAQYNIFSYTTQLVDWTKTFIKSLYDLGARKFAVMGTLPLGCLPGAKMSMGGPLKLCSQIVNGEATMFNGKLSTAVGTLNSSFPEARFHYVDMYTPLFDIVSNPQNYGFTNAADGCCCTVTSPIPCPDASKYVFWDIAHPTERVYKFIASRVIEDLKKNLA